MTPTPLQPTPSPRAAVLGTRSHSSSEAASAVPFTAAAVPWQSPSGTFICSWKLGTLCPAHESPPAPNRRAF